MESPKHARRAAAIVRLGLVVAVSAAGVALSQAPTISAEAEPATTYVGYPAQFRLTVVSSNDAPSFQWYLAGVGALPGSFTNVLGATNAVLSLTNLTLNNSGAYYAIVTNRSGSVTSAPVNLVVLTPPLPAVNLGEATTPTATSLALPANYLSQGNETNLSFSLSFDGAVLSSPTFEPAAPATLPAAPAGTVFGQASDALVTTVAHTNADGRVDGFGVTLSLDGGRVFPAGEQRLGTFRWQVAEGRAAHAGRIGWTNSPSGLKARSITNGVASDLLTTAAAPMLLGRDVVPRLDRQSGLYLQTLTLANPGNSDLTNARVTVASLPVDAHANQVVAYNALNRVGAGAVVNAGLLAAGGTKLLTLEYFVPDHQGWPTVGSTPILPELATSPGFPGASTLPNGVILAPAKVRVTRAADVPNAGFTGVLLDFPTQTNRVYYVEYSAQPDFTLTNQVRVAYPSVPGTGSTVQWIDNGPPKTESSPTSTATRFYRIVEVR